MSLPTGWVYVDNRTGVIWNDEFITRIEGVDIMLYIGEKGVEVFNTYMEVNHKSDGIYAGVLADYLEDTIEQSPLRDIAIEYYREVFAAPDRNQNVST